MVCNEGIIKQTALDVLHHFEVHEGFVEMDSIFPKLNLLVIRLGMVDVNITLGELITTGNIDLIKNEALRKEFISYYTSMKSFLTNSEHNHTNMVDRYILPEIVNASFFDLRYTDDSKLTLHNMDSLKNEIQVSDKFVSKLKGYSVANLNKPEVQLALYNQINFRMMLSEYQQVGCKSFEREIEHLIELIEQELRGKE